MNLNLRDSPSNAPVCTPVTGQYFMTAEPTDKRHYKSLPRVQKQLVTNVVKTGKQERPAQLQTQTFFEPYTAVRSYVPSIVLLKNNPRFSLSRYQQNFFNSQTTLLCFALSLKGRTTSNCNFLMAIRKRRSKQKSS